MRQVMVGGVPPYAAVDGGPTVFTMRWIFDGLFGDAGERLEEHLGLIKAETLARHAWRQGDIVIWDNRCTMHKANADYPEGERRLMHRVIVAGTAPV